MRARKKKELLKDGPALLVGEMCFFSPLQSASSEHSSSAVSPLVCSAPQKAVPQYQHGSPLLSFKVTKCDAFLGRPSLTTYSTCNPLLPFPVAFSSLAFVTVGHTLFFTDVVTPRLYLPREHKLRKRGGAFLFIIGPQGQE